MSKSLQITIYTKEDFHCCVKNIEVLLKVAGWSITDSSGKINFWNDKISEWECFNGTADEFVKANPDCWFYAYKDTKIIKVSVNSNASFTICPEAYAKKVSSDYGQHFDYNWYYEQFVAAFNKNKTIVERVAFDEY